MCALSMEMYSFIYLTFRDIETLKEVFGIHIIYVNSIHVNIYNIQL